MAAAALLIDPKVVNTLAAVATGHAYQAGTLEKGPPVDALLHVLVQ